MILIPIHITRDGEIILIFLGEPQLREIKDLLEDCIIRHICCLLINLLISPPITDPLSINISQLLLLLGILPLRIRF